MPFDKIDQLWVMKAGQWSSPPVRLTPPGRLATLILIGTHPDLSWTLAIDNQIYRVIDLSQGTPQQPSFRLVEILCSKRTPKASDYFESTEFDLVNSRFIATLVRPISFSIDLTIMAYNPTGADERMVVLGTYYKGTYSSVEVVR